MMNREGTRRTLPRALLSSSRFAEHSMAMPSIRRRWTPAQVRAKYWVVDLDGRAVERWTPQQETPVVLREQLIWAPVADDRLVIDLPEFFRRVTGKRVFRG